MSRIQPILLLAAVVITGCSSSDHSQKTPVATSPPPAVSQTDFSDFVAMQLSQAKTTETAAPAAVETTDFAFADDNNPEVFDPLLATAP